jgi:hypothetical protein
VEEGCAAGWERMGLLGGKRVEDSCAAKWLRTVDDGCAASWDRGELLGGRGLRCWVDNSIAASGTAWR